MPTDGDALAAIVAKPRAEAAIASLREEGVYDPTRSVEAHGPERVAIPVVEVPTETSIEDVQPVELPRRERGLEDLLAARGFTDAQIAAAPASWAIVGSVVLADFGDVSAERTVDGTATGDEVGASNDAVTSDGGAVDDEAARNNETAARDEGVADDEWREAVGDALLELHGEADTVLARGGVSGTRREPVTEVVAGTGETETVHVEHGTKYALDLSEVMFSPGNEAERTRMGEVVGDDERVFDMFAGVGYFALPMARSGATVTAAELNPDAYRLLVENAKLNRVSDRVRAVLGDCRDVETTADRVVMGHYEAHERLGSALDALVPGGTLHLHEATPEDRFPERPIERLESAAAAAGRDADVLETAVVKSHSAGVVHGVVDAKVA